MPGIVPGPEITEELLAFCTQHLARQKCPRSIDFESELAAAADRQALQTVAARSLLARPQDAHHLANSAAGSADSRSEVRISAARPENKKSPDIWRAGARTSAEGKRAEREEPSRPLLSS